MKIIDRYLIREFLMLFFYCLLCFIFLYIIIDLFGHLDEILTQHVPLQTLLQYYIAFIPIILVQIMPFASLISTIFILGNFNRYNEITAMRASGISLWRLILPFLITGLILSFMSLVINEKIIPTASLVSATIKDQDIEKTSEKKKDKIIKNVAFYGQENRMFYIKSFNQKEGMLHDIIILEHDSQQRLIGRLTSKKATFEDGKWKFFNSIYYPPDKDGKLSEEPFFYEEKCFDFPERPEDLTLFQHQTEFMGYFQLREYIKRFESSGYHPIKELVDLYSKISFPFINFVIIMLGIPFALKPTKGGALLYIGMSLAITFIFIVFMAVNIALGKGGILPPFVSAWLSNITFSIGGILMFLKMGK